MENKKEEISENSHIEIKKVSFGFFVIYFNLRNI